MWRRTNGKFSVSPRDKIVLYIFSIWIRHLIVLNNGAGLIFPPPLQTSIKVTKNNCALQVAKTGSDVLQ